MTDEISGTGLTLQLRLKLIGNRLSLTVSSNHRLLGRLEVLKVDTDIQLLPDLRHHASVYVSVHRFL